MDFIELMVCSFVDMFTVNSLIIFFWCQSASYLMTSYEQMKERWTI